MSNQAKPREVVDENGAVHALESCLGRGGQGEVWLVRGGRRVVKLLRRGRDREALRRQIAAVKRLDIHALHVARPLALLRPPEVGYVAEFLGDMMPIGKLMKPPQGEPVTAWYQRTGGLRRRLRLLAHAGEALAGLHALGRIYGDVSHHNVFVSAPSTASEAWLIDLDNLRVESSLEDAVYTPGYGAPEVVAGKAGSTSFSDAWGFAVLAFHVLTLVHPFLGDDVAEGEPELEEQAFDGTLPWIDHRTDARNRATTGIPRALVMGKRLTELAHAMFEEGVRNRARRPGVGAWVDRLHRTADQTLLCAGCGGTYLVNAPQCPWCGATRTSYLRVAVHRWEPGHGIVEQSGEIEKLPLAGEPLPLTRRLTHGEVGVAARAVHTTLEPQDSGVRVVTRGSSAWLTRPGAIDPAGAIEVTEKGRILPLHRAGERGFVIHFSRLDTPHRVATVSSGGGR